MKRQRPPQPTRAELARRLRVVEQERDGLLDVLAASTREVTDLRAELATRGPT